MVMIEELFYSDALPYAAVFLVFFAAVFFLLNRSMFKENKSVSTIIAICVSALAVWGLTNYTMYMYEISDWIGGFENSVQALIFFAVIALILLLLYKGFKGKFKRLDIKWGWLGVGGGLILIYYLPKLINMYYLPEVLQNENIRFLSLIAGIVIGGVGILKTRLLKLLKRTIGREEVG